MYIVTSTSNNIFTNSAIGDAIIYTQSNSQKLLLGTTINSAATLTLASNAAYFSNVNLGIGKSNPGFPLDIIGDLNFTGTLRQNGTAYVGSQWSNSGTNVFIIGSNIGIGKSNPSVALDVVGNTQLNGNLTFGNSIIMKGLQINPSDGTPVNITTTSVQGLSNDPSGIVFSVGSNTSNYSFRYWGNATEVARLTGDGKFGIGMSNPAFPLDVIGDLNFTGTLRQNGTAYVGSQWSNSGSNVFIIGSNIGIGLSNPTMTLDMTGNLQILNSNTNIIIRTTSNLSDDSGSILWRNSGGNYTWRLGRRYNNSNIPANEANLCFSSTGATGTKSAIADLIDVMTLACTGNIGIGTTTPSTSLDVVGSSTVNTLGNVAASFRAAAITGVNDAGVLIGSITGNVPYISDTSWGLSTGLSFMTSNINRMNIKNDGAVEIGGTLPVYEFPPVAFGSSNSLLTTGNTSYLQNGLYSVTTSRDNAPFLARLTFDNVTNNESSRWEPNNGGYGGGSGIWDNTLPAITTTVSSIATAGHWIQLTLPNSIVLRHIQITSSGDIRSPRNMVIAGSSDNGTTWTNLGTFSDIPNAAAGVTQQLTTTSVSQFNNYRFIVTRTWNSGNVAIRELSLFGNDGFRLGVNGSIQSRGKISAASNFVTHTNGEIERGFLKTIDLTSIQADTYLTFVGQNQNTEKKGAYLRFDQRDGTAYNAVGGDSIFNWAILQSNIGSETFVAGLDSLGHFSVNGTVSARGFNSWTNY